MMAHRSYRDEKIYNLVPMAGFEVDDNQTKGGRVRRTKSQQNVRYQSKFHPKVTDDFKQAHEDPYRKNRTMGLPIGELPNPKEGFLHKKPDHPHPHKEHSKHYRKVLKEVTDRIKNQTRLPILPPVPKREDNMIVRNAVSQIVTQATKPPERLLVDTPRGHRYHLEQPKTHSGLEKKFVFKNGYGQVPAYVRRRLRLQEAKLKVLEEYYADRNTHGQLYVIPEEQRQEILDGLKRAWDMCNKEYLALSLSSTTLRHYRQKLSLEHELKELEMEIKFVDAYKKFYLHADDLHDAVKAGS